MLLLALDMPTALRREDNILSGLSDAENNPSHKLRHFSRSPHPYHRRNTELVSPTEHRNEATKAHGEQGFSSPAPTNSESREEEQNTLNAAGSQKVWQEGSKSPSDSGSEADDESNGFLRGLPAPPQRLRKGLKDGRGLVIEVTPSPLLTPSYLDSDRRTLSLENIKDWRASTFVRHGVDEDTQRLKEKFAKRRKAELVRRSCEVLLVGIIGSIIWHGISSSAAARAWRKGCYFCGVHRKAAWLILFTEILAHFTVVLCLYFLYPFRLLLRLSDVPTAPGSVKKPHLRIPSAFDPAPLLYPIFLPVYTALVLLETKQSILLPNLILSLGSIPSELIPLLDQIQGCSTVHWIIATIPLLMVGDIFPASESRSHRPDPTRSASLDSLDPQLLILLYPLHQALLPTLQYLTTTSLLPTELQLLSISLINLLLHSTSPQAKILEALLWLGGLAMFILCRDALRWEVALARIPSWRFRRTAHVVRIRNSFLEALDDTVGKRLSVAGLLGDKTLSSDSDAVEFGPSAARASRKTSGFASRIRHFSRNEAFNTEKEPRSVVEASMNFPLSGTSEITNLQNEKHTPMRRHTLSTFAGPVSPPRLSTRTTSKRHKRSASSSANFFLSLTPAQAAVRKWLYALYVYAAVIFIITIGIRTYVSRKALAGNEPVGWALGYLLGDIQSFRFWVVKSNLERWINLPARSQDNATSSCHLGLVEHLRRDTFGEANTRLLIGGYCLVVLAVGMMVVLRLSAVVEVDTRRKVFHGTMVAMFLPSTFVDPTFAGLALALILAIFLLLDLFRASQLPPLSKPLTNFLAPYVDGRDHRGPVIVSHIFLLIGCAIPLWLSLAGIERTGQAPWQGWEVTRREVSMVSGVICVGMGDAAASLIGRRYGRRKWPWSGGKSLEGSFAFTVFVTLGLMFAKGWLRIGGWASDNNDQWFLTLAKSVMAASGASLTEAILTGGNDNVVVPVVLWLLVKGLRI